MIHGVLSPERQCRRQMILEWPSGHGAVRYGHPVNEDLFELWVVAMSAVGKVGWRGYALEDSASSSRDLMLSRRGLDFIGAE